MGKKKQKEEVGVVTPRREAIYNQAGELAKQHFGGQTPFEQEFIPQSQGFFNAYKGALDRQVGDYGDIMQGYKDWRSGLTTPSISAGRISGPNIQLRDPHNFTFREVNAPRSDEWTEGVGRFRNLADTGLATPESESAMGGYKDFATTGGYSPTDIQELRARGTAPIRAGYGNTMRELERARTLGGGAAPNFIAAASRVQRELPGQMADAMTGVNAELANAIRQGKLAGLGGMTGIDQALRQAKTTGISGFSGMAEADVSRQFQGQLANQQADMRTQELTEQGYSLQEARMIALEEMNMRADMFNTEQDMRSQMYNADAQARTQGMGFQGLEGMRGLYGTTPAMAATFGDQALAAYRQRAGMEEGRNQYGLNLLGQQLNALGQQAPPGVPWWRTALDIGSRVAPMFIPGGQGAGMMGASGSNAGMANMMPAIQPSGRMQSYWG